MFIGTERNDFRDRNEFFVDERLQKRKKIFTVQNVSPPHFVRFDQSNRLFTIQFVQLQKRDDETFSSNGRLTPTAQSVSPPECASK